MTHVSLSIVIPTHKRADILRECLRRIAAQTIKDQIEVIVVSDGHDDATAALFGPSSTHSWVRFMEIPKSQQGVARNRGVEKATGDIVLFIGDDIFLEPDACEVHLKAHASFERRGAAPLSPPWGKGEGDRGNKAVLGYTEWDPTLEITPVMKWLNQTGWQFGYRFLEPYRQTYIQKEIQHRFTYTSHISLPREVAQKFPFREDVTLYGWEDMEWGWRLAQAGLPTEAPAGAKAGIPLYYEPDAKAFHHHRMTLEDSLKRMETLGKSAVIVEGLNPELRLVPKGMKLLAYKMLALFPTMKGAHAKALMKGIAASRS